MLFSSSNRSTKDSVEEMNIQNNIFGMNGDIEQNGLKIKTEDISDDIEMESPPLEGRNGHTNGYQNGTSHEELVEDMGKDSLVIVCW